MRALTSWKLWIVLFILGLLGIGISLTMPIVYRLRAMRYFEHHPQQGKYELSAEHADWTERYGNWANGLRDVKTLRILAADDESLGYASALHDARSLVIVTAPGRPVSERGLSYLPPFERLEQLVLAGPGFTDESVARILALRPPLRRALFFEARFGPLTRQALAEASSLRELMILGRSLKDDDFRSLAPLPDLEFFAATGIGDQGADRLAGFPNVQAIFLLNSTITSIGLQRLSDCPSLSGLMLHGSQLTDDELVDFLSSKEITDLGIVDCPQLTAEGITRWPDLPHLETLTISPDLLTQESVARLKELPALDQIEVWGMIADSELRQAIDDAWFLDEQPEMTDDALWQEMRMSVLDFINE